MIDVNLSHIFRQFRRSQAGASAVEFAILLPVMMVVFAGIVEGSRIYWNYQSAVSGVRDASRFLARTTNSDICGGTASVSETTLPGGVAVATPIIAGTMRDEQNLFPSGVTVTNIQVVYTCPDYGLRVSPTPVARVNATVNIALPFGTLFNFFGARQNATMTSIITDQSRIYGI